MLFREERILRFFRFTIYNQDKYIKYYEAPGKTGRGRSVINQPWSRLSFSVLKIIVFSVSNK